MFVAVKEDGVIYGLDLEKLLAQADEGSNYLEITDFEEEPVFLVINGKVFNANDKDNKVLKAHSELQDTYRELHIIDTSIAPRPARDFFINNFPEKFTEDEKKVKEYIKRIYEGEQIAIKLRKKIVELGKIMQEGTRDESFNNKPND